MSRKPVLPREVRPRYQGNRSLPADEPPISGQPAPPGPGDGRCPAQLGTRPASCTAGVPHGRETTEPVPGAGGGFVSVATASVSPPAAAGADLRRRRT